MLNWPTVPREYCKLGQVPKEAILGIAESSVFCRLDAVQQTSKTSQQNSLELCCWHNSAAEFSTNTDPFYPPIMEYNSSFIRLAGLLKHVNDCYQNAMGHRQVVPLIGRIRRINSLLH